MRPPRPRPTNITASRSSTSISGEQAKAEPGPPSYTGVFAKALIAEAERDEKVVAITAAMPSGTGLDKFGEKFPDRMFDVGIAEQHAVTFAAGLAAQGMRPFCAIYSTFLQRAYDQVVHDVAIQNLPVRFAIDRAGLVGADGATHAGSFDVTYLCDAAQFRRDGGGRRGRAGPHGPHRGAARCRADRGPLSARQRHRRRAPETPERLEIGKGRIVREGKKVAILSLGTRLAEALKAADSSTGAGLSTTVADLRFAKPLDEELIRRLLATHEVAVTVEEASIGGLGAHVLTLASDAGLIDAGLKLRTMRLPDASRTRTSPKSNMPKPASTPTRSSRPCSRRCGTTALVSRGFGRSKGSRRPAAGQPGVGRKPEPSSGAHHGRSSLQWREEARQGRGDAC